VLIPKVWQLLLEINTFRLADCASSIRMSPSLARLKCPLQEIKTVGAVGMWETLPLRFPRAVGSIWSKTADEILTSVVRSCRPSSETHTRTLLNNS